MRPSANRIVLQTAKKVNDTARSLMAVPKTGRLYDRPGGKVHIASAPGEAPAIDTSNLIQSLREQMTGDLTAIAYTDVEYSVPLEFGSIQIDPRPFYLPAAEMEEDEFIDAMRKIIR